MNASELHAGMAVEWFYTERRGWSPSWWVPATVVRVNHKRVTINALRRDGTTKTVSVSPARLRTAIDAAMSTDQGDKT